MSVISRRSFIIGSGAVLAAPAIIKAENAMRLYVSKQEPVLFTGVYETGTHISVVWGSMRWVKKLSDLPNPSFVQNGTRVVVMNDPDVSCNGIYTVDHNSTWQT